MGYRQDALAQRHGELFRRTAVVPVNRDEVSVEQAGIGERNVQLKWPVLDHVDRFRPEDRDLRCDVGDHDGGGRRGHMNGVGPHVDPITVGETGVEGDLPGVVQTKSAEDQG